MKILVLDRANSWHVSDLKRAANGQHQIATATYDQLTAKLSSSNRQTEFFAAGVSLSNFDVVITRAMSGGGSLEQVVFRMDWLDQVQTQLGMLVINPAKAVEASVDKYLSFENMRAVGIDLPNTSVCQTAEQAIQFFDQHNCDVVVKPIFGSQGRGVIRIQERGKAEEHFSNLDADDRVIYMQEYIEHQDWDLRILVVGKQVFGMRRCRPGHWVTNASFGSECTRHEVTNRERQIALKATESQDAILAGVDLVYDPAGNPFVVEVNACPAWNRISEALETDIASVLIQFCESSIR